MKLAYLVSGGVACAALGWFVARHAERPPVLAAPQQVVRSDAQATAVPTIVQSSQRTTPTTPTPAPMAGESVGVLSANYDPADLVPDPHKLLLERFMQEHLDPEWSPGANDSIHRLLAEKSNLPPLDSLDVDCRQTLCRLQATMAMAVAEEAVKRDGSFSWDAQIAGLTSDPDWQRQFELVSSVSSVDNAAGQLTFDTYLHRKRDAAIAASL